MSIEALLSYGGLAVFLVVLLVNVLAFGFDMYLLERGYLTISHRAWENPRLIYGLVGWQLIGVIGLAVHLLIPPY